MHRKLSGFIAFLYGTNDARPLDPGNRNNPPGPPPVQTGTLEFIQPFAFQGQGHVLTDIHPVAPAWQDWGQFAVVIGGPGAPFGGGYSQDPNVTLPVESSLFYNSTTGQYYNLGG